MDFDRYKNGMPWPQKKEYVNPKVEEVEEHFVGTIRQIEAARADAIERGEAEYKEARRAYGAETARLEAQFKADLEEETGLQNHPKKDKLYAKAWERGHSGGLSEVYNEYLDLSDLLE